MAGRTVFVNPAHYGRKKAKTRKNPGSTGISVRDAFALGKASANPKRRKHGKGRKRRRNAGIAPFVQNPLIMSNPRRRRRHHSNPFNALSLKNVANKGLTYAGGAGIAVGANALAINRIDNVWARNGARLVGAVVGANMLKGDLGASMAGAMFYPMIQELAAMLLGKSAVTGTEADMDVLAADLEDVMDDLDDAALQDDDLEADLGDDDDILA